MLFSNVRNMIAQPRASHTQKRDENIIFSSQHHETALTGLITFGNGKRLPRQITPSTEPHFSIFAREHFIYSGCLREPNRGLGVQAINGNGAKAFLLPHYPDIFFLLFWLFPLSLSLSASFSARDEVNPTDKRARTLILDIV